MEKHKPLNIIYKKDINRIGDELTLARYVIKADNAHLKLTDIQILRLVLLGCLYANISNFVDVNIQSDKNKPSSIIEVRTTVESYLGEGIVEKYTELPIEKLQQVRYEAAISYFKIITNIPMWKSLLPYSLEMLDYSEQDLKYAWRDRRFGVITEKKKQSGVYYTPPDVAKYMVDGCLDKLENQYASLLSCRYIDFSCGSGVFLLQLIDSILEREVIKSFDEYRKFVCSCVFGMDVSGQAVECARYMIIQHSINLFRKQKLNIHQLLDDLKKNIVSADATNLDTYFRQHPGYPSKYECIIGNPPYVGIRGAIQTPVKSNLFIPFVYNLQKYSSKCSVSSLVLPLSFVYNNQPGFCEMRQIIDEDGAEWLVENYDRSPDSLFGDDVKARACIVFRIKGTGEHKVFVSGLMRWTSTSREQLLSTSKALTDITELPITEYIPKLAGQLEKDAYAKIMEHSDSLLDTLRSQSVFSEKCIAIKGTAYNWICAYDHLPSGFNSDGSPYISKDLRIYSTENQYFALAYLNSRIAFWLWTVIGDGFHVTKRLLSVAKVFDDSSKYDELAFLGKEFSNQITQYPTISVNSGKTITSYSHSPLMDIVSKIDCVIAEGLSLNECFPTYLCKWYSNIVSCGRDATKRYEH